LVPNPKKKAAASPLRRKPRDGVQLHPRKPQEARHQTDDRPLGSKPLCLLQMGRTRRLRQARCLGRKAAGANPRHSGQVQKTLWNCCGVSSASDGTATRCCGSWWIWWRRRTAPS